MTQPNNYGFEEEAGMLRDGARRLFAEKLQTDRLRSFLGPGHIHFFFFYPAGGSHGGPHP